MKLSSKVDYFPGFNAKPDLDEGFADLRFDVDLSEDLDLLRGLCAGASMTITALEILARWRKAQAV